MSWYSIKFISLLLQACLCVYVNWRNDEWMIVYMGFFYDVVFFFSQVAATARVGVSCFN